MKSEEFIREVDEELQRERMLKLWRQYGAFVVAGLLALILGTAAKVGWDHWQHRARSAEALRFAQAEQALEAQRNDEAAAAFAALAADGKTGYAALARLREAQARIAAGQQAEANAALDQLGTSEAGDAILGDLGTILAVARELEAGDPAELARRLEPLAAAGSPWRHHARELLALLALRAGDTAKARGLLEELSKESGVPATQQRRAQELLQAIGGSAQQASS